MNNDNILSLKDSIFLVLTSAFLWFYGNFFPTIIAFVVLLFLLNFFLSNFQFFFKLICYFFLNFIIFFVRICTPLRNTCFFWLFLWGLFIFFISYSFFLFRLFSWKTRNCVLLLLLNLRFLFICYHQILHFSH